MKTNRILAAGVGLAVASLALAGCSGDTGGTTPQAQTGSGGKNTRRGERRPGPGARGLCEMDTSTSL